MSKLGIRMSGVVLIGVFLLALALGTGWIVNIYKFTQLDFERPVKAEVLRGIGLFPPFGAIIGWVPIKDGK
ncbi:MAG: hypothetical protein DRR06_15155 [Gammaproteobacteria bacterium]|nr:MAG: hypothetical protein DRR06_15155 [Gammaproteobacteria bacterium]